MEFKVFLSSKQKNQIFTYLKSYFEIEENFTHNYIKYTSPGNLIKFDPIVNELEITSLNEFDKVSSEILKMFNKTKKDIYINFLLFLVDIKFLELSKINKNYVQIADTKNKINSLLTRYYRFNLNSINVYNQFTNYLNYVR